MASSDKAPIPTPSLGDPNQPTPGAPMTTGQHLIDKGAEMMQSLKPIKQISQHICTFAIYSHDMNRQIETHHYVTRANQDFLQCAVYDSDDSNGRLIGVEYIVSERLFQSLDPDEQKLWHSHAYEIKSGLWVTPRIPETIAKPELENMTNTYGKFWCTWQSDRGDKLPMGAPALMVSPQLDTLGTIKPDLIKKRDEKYNISTETMQRARVGLSVPKETNPNSDYWKQSGKGFAIDVEPTEMKLKESFP